jgi:hypothetical protein
MQHKRDDDINRQPHATTGGARLQGPEVVEHFLLQLRPDGPWSLQAILPDDPPSSSIPKIIAVTFRTIADALQFVAAHNGKRNLYYSVNPLKHAMNKKAKKIDIAAIEYCLADLDPKDTETSEAAKAHYLEQLNGSFEPKTTGLIDSGNGIQCLWQLSEPIDLTPYPLVTVKDENGKDKLILGPEAQRIVDDVEARIKEIMIRLGAEPGTQNIDRILRLPGTINLPNEKKRKDGRVECPTELISFNGASYSLDQFPLPEQTKADEQPRDNGPKEEGDRLERLIRDGPREGEFNSKRSGAVWYVVCEMLRRNIPDIAIEATLLNRAYKISDHIYEQANPRSYVKKQIADARAKVRPTVEVFPASQWYGEKRPPSPPQLVKGVFPQTGVATFGGQSGAGKSFQAIHLGIHLIPDCKQNFYIDKYPIKRHGGVLYLVLEGKSAFPLRVTAAFETLFNRPMQMEFGERLKMPFAWNTYAPNLFEKGPDNLMKLVDREAQRMRQEFSVDLVAVFLDTMGLAACYENEDRSAQVLKVVSGLNRMSEECGALAINVDHMGKDQDAGLRGTSAKRDAVETILTCLIDRDKNTNKAINHRMQLFKIRDGEEGRVIPYRLKQVPMGKDEDGDELNTCVIQWEFDRPMQTRNQKKKQKTDVMLEMAIDEVGLPAQEKVLRDAFYRHHGGEKHAANMAWNRALRDGGLVFNDGKLYRQV